MHQKIYDEILQNPDDAESKICLQTIENLSKLLANFAKYEWVHFGNLPTFFSYQYLFWFKIIKQIWLICSEPIHMNEPVEQFLPIKGDQIHFIDFSNEGLKRGKLSYLLIQISYEVIWCFFSTIDQVSTQIKIGMNFGLESKKNWPKSVHKIINMIRVRN